jgi:hypothetical protein
VPVKENALQQALETLVVASAGRGLAGSTALARRIAARS